MSGHLSLFEEPNFEGRAALINSLGNYRNLRKIGFPKNALSSMKIGPGVMVELYDREGFQGHVKRYHGPSHIPSLGNFCRRTGSIRILKLNPTGGPQGSQAPAGLYDSSAVGLSGAPLSGLYAQSNAGAQANVYGGGGQFGPEGVPTPKPAGVPSPRFDVSPQIFPPHVGSQPVVVPTGTLSGLNGQNGPNDLYGGRRSSPAVILYSAGNYRGTSVPITQVRDIANLNDIGFPSNALASIKVNPGYVVIIYTGPNFTGQSKQIKGPAQLSDLGNFNNTVKSLKVVPASSNLQATASPNWLWWIIIIIVIILILLLIFRR
jgi:hypothetical protein